MKLQTFNIVPKFRKFLLIFLENILENGKFRMEVTLLCKELLLKIFYSRYRCKLSSNSRSDEMGEWIQNFIRITAFWTGEYGFLLRCNRSTIQVQVCNKNFFFVNLRNQIIAIYMIQSSLSLKTRLVLHTNQLLQTTRNKTAMWVQERLLLIPSKRKGHLQLTYSKY